MDKSPRPSKRSHGEGPDLSRRELLTGAARITLAALVTAVLPRVRQAHAGGVAGGVPIETWRRWIDAALSGISQGVDEWTQAAQLTGGVVNASNVFLKPGSLSGPSFEQLVHTSMQNAGAPGDVAAAFSGVSWEAWRTWAASYYMAINKALPQFAAVAAGEAPDTPIKPRPLRRGIAPGRIGMTPDVLARALSEVLMERMDDPNAAIATEEFARVYSNGFAGWYRGATLVNVLGKGPVPSFAPPYVPVGPVVLGEVYSTKALEAGPFLA
ncbi:MAG TPA: hypothetical protein VEC57_05185 [Candidatus Limnocylindrales bacterium]|nr:hypothetical protein [Candidatus Limnocylindrales bacterium]